jgi:hypothetical protein
MLAQARSCMATIPEETQAQQMTTQRLIMILVQKVSSTHQVRKIQKF